MKTFPDNTFDSVVTDAPYHLTSIVKRFGTEGAVPAKEGTDGLYARASKGFMGKTWDGGDNAFRIELWAEVLRVLKPGGHVVAFSGTRTYHRMACAIEDAGFEIRDMLSWLYGTGFPKSLDVAKALDKKEGHWRGRADETRQWEGWSTALKPALEPICFARKPLSESTVAANVLKWGVGAINVDACRIESEKLTGWGGKAAGGNTWDESNCGLTKNADARPVVGRWPANVMTDGSVEMPNGAQRFFYSAKASKEDRADSKHPTVKPINLMKWLCKLVTPPGGMTLDPFAGSGTTGQAAVEEGFNVVLIEREQEYQQDIVRRMGRMEK